MAIVKPFRGLRPKPSFCERVSSVPYDVVNTEEARALAGDNEYSFLRVVRSEIDFDAGFDPYAEEVYQRAKDNLARLVSKEVLIEEEDERLYVYRIEMGDHSQTGIIGLSSVDEYDEGLVKIHEKTRPEKENDRTKHMVTIGAQPGPVLLSYRADSELSALVERETEKEALYDFTAEDGVRHIIWRADKSAEISRAFEKVPHTYIADGHHRAKSSSRCREELRAKNSAHSGEESYNYFLTVLFPHSELRILAYNRIIRSLSQSTEAILSALSEVYVLTEGANPSPERKGEVAMYLAGKWYGLAPREGETVSEDPVESLDVSVLYQKALGPIFGIGDPRTDKNIDFVGGIRGTAELERLVDGGEAACAFSMYPVTTDELFAVADKGLLMAPKSTWFEPKLRSGLLVHKFREGE